MNQSVLVIEPRDRTGGHVDTYIDPHTGSAIDVGVLYYHNISVMTDFAQYVGVPMTAESLTTSDANKTHIIDFSAGTAVPEDEIAALGDTTAAFLKYYSILSEYPYLQSGFHLPSPVPEDLLLPWKDFIVQHDLSGLAFSIDLFNQGWKDILNMPTLYILKGFGQLLLQSFFAGYELATARHNNQELFDAAVRKIGQDRVLLSSHVEHVSRSPDGVFLVAATPKGQRLVKARKLLITAPPLLDVLEPFMSLDDEEHDIFGRFDCGYYWNALLRSAALPDADGIYNVGSNNSYYIADQPGILTIIPTGVSQLHRVYYGSPTYMTDEEVVDSIMTTTEKALQVIAVDGDLSVPFIRSHAPYHCTVSADDIRAGFYDRLQALQGKKSTYYTGATFQAHDSGSIWLFTENEVLTMLV
ncbi:hypothetical protein AMS68_006845 [Peltaster fructicola]|uniref:Amine oxidase domain-containing protein n=1 Tax=Peltaster fructicola TaxID=286661 RepID=A0A6H0Y3A6_9PEZI|nr:hypothetical protein AMS68_006845 [Peltaster fructicola]